MLLADNPATIVGTPDTGTTTATVNENNTMATVKLFLSPPPQPPQPPATTTPTTPVDLQQHQPQAETVLTHAIVSLSSANRVFQIPELADNIAVYLRPIYISQLRLVSRALYIAYRPHLRLHLHRESTESWTSFPTLKDPVVADTAATTAAIVTTASTESKTTDRAETCEEGEVKQRTPVGDIDDTSTPTATIIATSPNATSATTTDTVTETVASLDIQESSLRPQQKQEVDEQEENVEALKLAPKKAGSGYGYEDGHTYGNLVETLTTDSLDNLERLIPIMQQCPNIHTLSITRWNKELSVFEDLLHNSPRLKSLSVAFYTTVDLTEFLGTLTGTSTSSRIDGTGCATQARQRGAGCGTLQSLDIKHRVPDINPIEWKALKAALDVLPCLRHLSLTGVEFTGGTDNNGEGGIVGGVGGTPQGFAALLNGGHPTLTPWHTTTTGISSPSLVSAPKQPQPQQGIFPHIQSLSLSICDCPAATMQEINRVFPGLTSLELNRCRSNWFQVFEPDPSMPASPHLGPATASVTSFVSPASSAVSVSIATGISSSHVSHSTSNTAHSPAPVLPRVPFPELRHLKLTARQGYEILLFNLDLVAHRPYLTSIEIYDMSLKIETLSSLVSVCKAEGRFLKRWAHSVSGAYMSLDEIQTYLSWDEIQTNEVPSLSKVQHLYVQKPGVLSFGSTLTSLHIGDEGNFRGTFAMRSNVIKTWNEILQKLPRLRVLKIDQLVKGYCLFQHLGRQPVGEIACCSSKSCSISEGKDKELAPPTTTTTTTMTEEGEGRVKEEKHQVGSFETSEGAWSIQVPSPSSTAEQPCRNTPGALPATEATKPAETSTLTPVPTPAAPVLSSATETTTGPAVATTPKLETPFLEELHVAFEWDLEVSTADMNRELIQRFRLLEKLYVTSMRKPDDFAVFTEQTRPGLAIVHRRHENL